MGWKDILCSWLNCECDCEQIAGDLRNCKAQRENQATIIRNYEKTNNEQKATILLLREEVARLKEQFSDPDIAKRLAVAEKKLALLPYDPPDFKLSGKYAVRKKEDIITLFSRHDLGHFDFSNLWDKKWKIPMSVDCEMVIAWFPLDKWVEDEDDCDNRI